MNWKNGTPARVVATKAGRIWRVEIQNARGAVLRTDDGCEEATAPHPGSRSRTETEAKRIARAHGVRAYRRDDRAGHIALPAPWLSASPNL